MTRTIELEYETSMGIFDLDVTLKGEGNSKAEFIDPDLKSIECKGDITDLLKAAGMEAIRHWNGKYQLPEWITGDILEKAWEKDRMEG
jgi:hypothetical protein